MSVRRQECMSAGVEEAISYSAKLGTTNPSMCTALCALSIVPGRVSTETIPLLS